MSKPIKKMELKSPSLRKPKRESLLLSPTDSEEDSSVPTTSRRSKNTSAKKTIYGEDMVIIRRKNDLKPSLQNLACKSCDIIFPGSSYLRRHQKTCVINVGDKYGKKNAENDSTDESNSSTSNKGVIDTTTKDGNNLISCEECSYTCNLKSKLKIHKRVHSGEKPFSCYVCDFTCSHSGNLKVHIRQHTGEKPFACSECNYSSPQINRLKTHMRVHTGEKPYSCDLCPFTCTLANNLKIHKRNHTNEKPFVCQLCAYSCKHMSNLKKHLTIHIAKAFACGSCNFKSGNSVQYTMHMLKHKENSKLPKSAGKSKTVANDFQNVLGAEEDPLRDVEIVYRDDGQTILDNQQTMSFNGGNPIQKYY